jgi:hypothetical protein
MRRPAGVFSTVMVGAVICLAPAPANAEHGNADEASPNMLHLAQRPRGGTNSDLAFWNNLAAAGNYNGFRLFDITKPQNPVVLSTVECRGPQGDVSYYKAKQRLLVFVSVDTPQTVPGPPPGARDCASSDTIEATGFEGIRIWDVTDPRQPKFVKFVRTDCGSHTHTTIPDPDDQRALIYVSSYPLAATGVGPNCGEPSPVNGRPHGKISIVQVPDANPAAADVLKEQHLHADTLPSTGELGSLVGAVGCHDITVLTEANQGPEANPGPREEVAAAACLTEGQLWDVSDPANPRTLDPDGHTHVHNESIEIWHSSSFTNDGRVVLFGDEHGGGMAPGCGGSADPTGNIWFYRNVPPGSPAAPLLGRYALPRPQVAPPQECSLHNFNVVPVNDNRAYIGVSSTYRGGTTVFDFSDARSAEPFEGSAFGAPLLGREIGFYDAQVGGSSDTWSTYWYNDYIWANDGLNRTGGNRGFDVFKILLPDENGRQLRARKYHHLNPQTQEVFTTVGAGAG